MVENQSSPDQRSDLPPGYDEEDPYEGEDLDKYPEWWRENIEEFKKHDMRPYRPPKFEDDEVVPEVIQELRDELGADVRIRKRNPQEETQEDSQGTYEWDLVVDGERITTVPRHRVPEGYTKYEMTSGEFERAVRNAFS